MKGRSEVPDMRLEVLQEFVTNFTQPPELRLQRMFPSGMSPSSTIKWESKVGGRGMVPFKAPGAETPRGSMRGFASHSAEAAFWGEKLSFDEEFLNNLRKPGTEIEYLTAQEILAEGLADVTNRAYRRKEWMFAKMLTAGSFSYLGKGEVMLSVDYGVPDTHIVTLPSNENWENGPDRKIMKNCITARRTIKDDCGAQVTNVLCNDSVLEYMSTDSDILTLLSKSGFGNGNLFDQKLSDVVGANPAVLGNLLHLPNFEIYDELFEVRAYLTGAVTASSTTVVSVDNPADFEDGMTARLTDASTGEYEDVTISSVSELAGTITLSGTTTGSYKAGEDFISVFQPFIPDDTIVFVASRVEGKPIAKYKQAPYGIPRKFGLRSKTWVSEDPEVQWVKVEDKGLPVLYQRDAIYILKVKP